MEKILRALGRPIFLLDQKSQKILFVNGPGEELLGASSADIEGKSWKQYFDEPSTRRIDALMEILETNRATEGRQELQLTLKRRTGRPVSVNLTLTPFLKEAKPAWLFDLEDLTPILNLQKEKELLVTEMSRVSKLADIGRLTGGIAHELNNPLAILQGLVENIEMSIDENDISPESLRRDLKPMQDTLTRMIRIIQSMMSVARGEEPQMENLALQEVWDRAATNFTALNEFEGIDLRVKIDERLRAPIDSIRIEQVLINLVKNALYALKLESSVPPRLTVVSSETADQLSIAVEDNGPGIPPSVAENLFTPFFTTKPVGKGTGLGLFLCYNIMRAHGGSLRFENVEPHGVRFILSFPKQKRSVVPANLPRILVVNGEEGFRQILQRRLDRWGFSVTTCGTGREAILTLNASPDFDLVLTDLKLTDTDGAQLVDEIRRKLKLPIVFVTEDVNDTRVKHLADTNVVQGVVRKPIDDTEFKLMIEDVMGAKLPEAFGPRSLQKSSVRSG
ncbi:MAG: response regulator [Bdellovibrionaceae bacterium]|nr:response regulator [Pseudobdellovibrionaceae bacterium]